MAGATHMTGIFQMRSFLALALNEGTHSPATSTAATTFLRTCAAVFSAAALSVS